MVMPDFMSTDARNTTLARQFVGRIVLISSSVLLSVTACRESPVSDARVPPASDAPVSERDTQSSTLDTLAPSSTAPSLQVVSHVATPLLEKRLATRNQLIDPHRDGWDSEVKAELAGQRLDEIATAVIKGAKADELEKIDWVDPAFTCGDLYSGDGEVVFQSPQLEVKRPQLAATGEGRGNSRFSGVFTTMAESIPSGATARAHVKTIGVTSGNATLSTEHIVSFFWSHEQGSASYLAAWTCDWKEVANELLLLTIRATDVEEVRYTDSADGRGVWFQDDTATVLADCPSYHAQLVPGLNH